MKYPQATLIRHDDNIQEESLGYLVVFDGIKKLMECVTLELPDRNNQTSISRINAKRYFVKPRWSQKYKKHFIIEDVECRDYILFHPLNKYSQTRGCIGIGTSFVHINEDKILDVNWSRRTLNKMLKLMPNGFWLTIINQDK